MNALDKLLQVGFTEAGKWFLESADLGFELSGNVDKPELLYAFVSGEEILYIGKTTKTLRKRIYGYKKPGPTQFTNILGHQNIVKLLREGREVKIFSLTHTGKTYIGGIQVNLAAGFEDSLIRDIQPTWNKMGK